MPLKQMPRALFFPLLFLFILPLSSCMARGRVDVGGGPNSMNHPPAVSSKRQNGPPAHAPAHGRRAKYSYRYFPDEAVYYDTNRQIYFYMNNGAWVMSVALPGSIRLGSAYVAFESATAEPYQYHDEHKKKYPPGKTKKKNKKYMGSLQFFNC